MKKNARKGAAAAVMPDDARARDGAPIEGAAAAQWLRVDSLSVWAKNPRDNRKAIAKVRTSIERFGFGAPILARRENREIIAGHTRYAAALELGLELVPVRLLDLPEEEAHLLALADNKVGEHSVWEKEQLAEVLSKYGIEDAFDAGFSQKECEQFMGEGDPLVLEETDLAETLQPEFWLSVSGPLPSQPDVLEKLRDALLAIDGVAVHLGKVE